MATIQSGGSPGSRIDAGDSVLAATKSLNTKPVTKRLTAFRQVHQAYIAADTRAQKATAALRKQQEKVAELDVDQDEAVNGLAGALPADGLPRANPFKVFGAPAPAALCGLGYGEEARQILALEKAVRKRAELSAASRAAAGKAGAAAKKVLSALDDIPRLEKARADAITARNALEQGWETAFAGFKRAALAAEDEGAQGLFTALFDRAPRPKKAKGKKGKGEETAGAGEE